MFLAPKETQTQTHDHNQKKTSKPQRLPFRTSCDPCAASKVRCTKEQHGCSRCVQNGLKCVYGRSRRKGKPPSKKTAIVHQPLHSSRVPISLDLPAAPQSSATGPNHHQHNYNHSCSWYRSMSNYSTPTEWERRTPNSSTHQSLLDEDVGTSHLPTSFPYNETRARSNENGGGQERDEMRKSTEDRYRQPEPCIAIACRTLSSLYQFIQSDCEKGHTTNNQSHHMPTPTTKESTNDIVFRMTRSATETISRLLNCTSRCCAQDPSILLVLDSILLKTLTWYEALYRSEIGELGLSDTVREDLSLRHSNTGQSGDTNSTGLLHESGRIMELTYTVPLTIPLTIGTLNLSPVTGTKMKAQLLLGEVHTLAQVCQVLGRRVQAAESITGEENLCGQSNTHLLRKVGELQRALTVVCTQVPSLE